MFHFSEKRWNSSDFKNYYLLTALNSNGSSWWSWLLFIYHMEIIFLYLDESFYIFFNIFRFRLFFINLLNAQYLLLSSQQVLCFLESHNNQTIDILFLKLSLFIHVDFFSFISAKYNNFFIIDAASRADNMSKILFHS